MANQHLTLDDPRYPARAEKRFWSFVDKEPSPSGCWSWTGGKYPAGYGKFSYMGKNITASRYSWILHFGPIPDNLHALHTCDNRECANPDHLFLGTHADNMRDKDEKNRGNYPLGERQWRSKLCAADVIEIRKLRIADPKHWTHIRLGNKFGVNGSNISRILSGKTWTHV